MSLFEESIPLLTKPRKTPLPKFQLFILLWVQLAEPITSQVIYPFVNQLVSELPITGGDPTKVGYYAGLIESLFFVTEAFTVLQWSSLSDRVGRKPILLIGLVGLSLSMVSFGLSKNFWGLVVSRCLAGLLNGNVGVIKSMMGELTDSTNIAQGMSLMPVVWSTGAIVGPIIGGLLSNPYDRFPHTFGRFEFWAKYPYALPCFVVALYCVSAVVLAWLFLDETVVPYVAKPAATTDASALDGPAPRARPAPTDAPLPLRAVLTPRVLTAITTYALLALLDIALRALQPLFYTTPRALGGLGLRPPAVGAALAAFGLLSALWQALAFAPVHARAGTRSVFVAALATFGPMFALFPAMNAAARREGGVGALTLVELAMQGVLYVIMDMGFSCAFIYVRAAAPSRRSLGATNGLAQTSISVVRAIGPALSNALFAVSLEKNIAGGWFVYIVFIALTGAALYAASYLPKTLWNDDDDASAE